MATRTTTLRGACSGCRTMFELTTPKLFCDDCWAALPFVVQREVVDAWINSRLEYQGWQVFETAFEKAKKEIQKAKELVS